MENKLVVPQEFEVACVIHGIEQVKVLQSFIDFASFYTSLSSGISKGYREVAQTIRAFRDIQGISDTPGSFTDYRDVGIQCIKEMSALVMKKGMTEGKKRKKSVGIVRRLRRIMKTQPQMDNLYLSNGQVLSLSDDLLVICGFNKISPVDCLNYFMSQISLPDMHARAGLKKEINPAMIFFDSLSFLIPDWMLKPEIHAEYFDFIDAIQELHAEVFFIRDLDKRTEVYRQFFLTYYNKFKN